MMKLFTRIFFVTLIAFGACTPIKYYHPVNTIAPVFDKGGDLQLYGGIGESDNFTHYNGQFTYSFDSVQFIAGNFLMNGRKDVMATDAGVSRVVDGRRTNIAELGYGRRFYKHDNLNVFVQTNASYGNSYIEQVYNSKYGFRDLSYFKLNIMPSFTLSTKIIELGFNCKLGAVYFTQVNDQGKYAAEDTDYYNDFDYIARNRNMFEIQPSLFMGIGYKKFKIITQATQLSLSHNKLKYDDLYLSIGVRYVINTRLD